MAQELPEIQTPLPEASAAPTIPPRSAPAISRPLLALLLVLAAVAYRSLALWNADPGNLPVAEWFFFGWSKASAQAVFALAAAVAFSRRRYAAVALHDEGSLGLALPLLSIALALFVWGNHAEASDVVVISLIALLLGSALLLFGTRFMRRIALPVLLLAFAIPPPGVVLNHIVFPLQLWTANAADWLLNTAGIPAIREGDVLLLANGGFFEVIESCSGMRSIEVLTMLALAIVGILAVPRWHAVLLVASAPVIAYLVNAVRVVSLILWLQSEFSLMHSAQGVVLFLAGLVGLWSVDALLRCFWRSDPVDSGSSAPTGGPEAEAAGRRRRRSIGLSLLLATLVAASFVTPRWAPPQRPAGPPLELPEQLGGWTAAEDLPVQWRFLGKVRFSKHWHRRYVGPTGAISVFVGYDDRLIRSRSLLSRKNAFPGPGWELEEEAQIELAPGGLVVQSLQMRSEARRVLAYHWFEGRASLPQEVLRAVLATDQSLLRREQGALVVRLATALEPGPRGRELAEARLREMAALLAPPMLRTMEQQANGTTGDRDTSSMERPE